MTYRWICQHSNLQKEIYPLTSVWSSVRSTGWYSKFSDRVRYQCCILGRAGFWMTAWMRHWAALNSVVRGLVRVQVGESLWRGLTILASLENYQWMKRWAFALKDNNWIINPRNCSLEMILLSLWFTISLKQSDFIVWIFQGEKWPLQQSKFYKLVLLEFHLLCHLVFPEHHL